MIKYLSILVFIFFFINSFAQKVVIKGNAPGAEGKTLEVIAYSDQVTYLEHKVASTFIDDKGNFTLQFNADNTFMSFITIEYHKAELYIEPNSTYELKIQRVNYDSIYEIVNPFLDQQYLQMEILNTKETELNTVIGKFNSVFNNFIVSYGDTLYVHPSKKRIEFFLKKTETDFSGFDNEYFKAYCKYKLASLYMFARLKGNDEMIKKYFYYQPVLYDNVEYMDLFNNLFSNYILSGSRKIKYKDLETTINYKANYPALLDSLGKDTILRNEVFRELVLLKNLNDLLGVKDFSKENIIHILHAFILKTKFEQHRIIAQNIISAATKLNIATQAPTFSLKDINGRIVSLENFKGKYIYLFFFKSDCLPCETELKLINDYEKKYGNKIEFIGVSLDRKKETFMDFLLKNNFTWHVLYFNGDKELIEKYNAKSLPLFVFIDENGDILNYPARMPSENVETVFQIFTQNAPNKIKR